MKRVLLAAALVLVVFSALFVTWPVHAEPIELGVVYVPTDGVGRSTVPVEVVTPLPEKRDAFQKAKQLKHLLLGRKMRPMAAQDTQVHWGKCIVMPHQLELGEATLRVECWSFAMWPDDNPLKIIEGPATAQEVMLVIETFLEVHNKRLKRPVSKPSKPSPPGKRV